MSNEFKFLSDGNRDEFLELVLRTKSGILIKDLDMNTFNLLIRYLDIKNDSSFIITQSGNQIGMFLGATRGKRAYISNMFISDQFRKKGYGTVLLQKGISIFKEKNCGLVRLEVLKDNTSAIKLYIKEGFDISGEILQYQNNKNSFYSKPSDAMNVERTGGFIFQPLFRTFKKDGVPWIRELRSLISLIDAGYVDLNLLKKGDIVIGYVISNRNNGCLKIYDVSISEEHLIHLNQYLTLLLGNERTVQICSLYKKDRIISLIENSGFFPNIFQYEMTRKL
jgi:ribosomal protein S18 acetylase RimI-like enzyme